MKRTIITSALLTLLLGTFYVACHFNVTDKVAIAAPDFDAVVIKRGEYLVLTNVCDDCHSPKKIGPNGPEIIPELRLSGFRQHVKVPAIDTHLIKQGWTLFNEDFTSAVGVWGESFAANLTSDETGIGNWKVEQFIKAIREGKMKGLDGTRPILPPMPWPMFKNMTDDDLKAIYAYLKTTKPVKNIVPQPIEFKDLK